MSAPDITIRLNEMRRQRQFRQITQSLLPVLTFAHLAARYQRARGEARQKFETLREINLELMVADARRRAAYVVVLVASLAVYAIDFILLSAVAEYFARRVYSDPFMVTLARAVVPAAILSIEIMIASQRAFAQEWEIEHGSSKTSWLWVFFSLLLLCVLPSMLVATHIVSMPSRMTRSLEIVNILQMIGLVALAVVMHGVVLYGGQLAVEAKAYIYLTYRSWRLGRQVRRLDEKYQKAATSATHAYILHERAVQEYRSIYPSSDLTPGPFDLTTHRLLRTRLGREIPGLPPPSDTSGREGYGNLCSDGELTG
jgi:hypothetical protein